MSRVRGLKVEDCPPPAYREFGQESENEGSSASAASQIQVPPIRNSRLVSRAASAAPRSPPRPSPPSPPPPSPPQPAVARPIALQTLQTTESQRCRPQTHTSGTQPGNPFADPVDSASGAGVKISNLRLRIQAYFCILLINLPFLVMFIMDIVGTYIISKSGFYRSVVLSYAFIFIYITLGFLTAAINIGIWIWSSNRRETPHRCWACPRYSLLCFVIAGILLWPLIEVFGIQKKIKPMPLSCKELGFSSSILLEVVGGKTNRFAKLWPTNNATIESDGKAFGLTLSPAVRPEKSHDVFSFVPSVALTTPTLFPSVASNEVTIRLSEKNYGFQYMVPKVPGTLFVRNGTFKDDRNYYLSFPTMSPPLHSTTKGNWSYEDWRPWVEMVDNERIVLTTTGNLPRDMVNTMMRMCGAWSLNDMVENEQRMETVLVVLARMMIEMAMWGLDY